MIEWTGRMRDRLDQPRFHDPYMAKGKLTEPTVCGDCGAVYHKGRWQWAEAPAGAHQTRCPACTRIHDDYPAGFVNLKGEFVAEHRDDILGIVRNIERREQAEHPIERVMSIEDEDGGLLVTTTEVHLAQAIGEAVHHAYHGKLECRHADSDNTLHVAWER